MQGFQKQKLTTLLVGTAAIYGIYSLNSIIMEKVFKLPYANDETGEMEVFDFAEAQVFFASLFTFVVAHVINRVKHPPEVRNCIPWYHGLKSGAAVATSAISYSYAVKFTNFPLVMMIRSCSILSVVIVGVLFTGVKDTSEKLGGRKIIVAIIATAGMLMFKLFEEGSQNAQYSAETLGLVLIFTSLLADGLMPDFQAVIKERYRPVSTVMLEVSNMWTAIVVFIFSMVMGHLVPMIQFILTHKSLLLELVVIGMLSAVGQLVIYYLAMSYRQHVVPLIIGTRKVFSVAFSLFYFKHQTNRYQITGLALVFIASANEFLSESQAKPKTVPKQEAKPSQPEPLQNGQKGKKQ